MGSRRLLQLVHELRFLSGRSERNSAGESRGPEKSAFIKTTGPPPLLYNFFPLKNTYKNCPMRSSTTHLSFLRPPPPHPPHQLLIPISSLILRSISPFQSLPASSANLSSFCFSALRHGTPHSLIPSFLPCPPALSWHLLPPIRCYTFIVQ
jgi:hypothetical protein